MFGDNPVNVVLFCHEPQVPVEPVLLLYCVVQPFGAVVELIVMLVAVGVPLTVRCAGAPVVSNEGAVGVADTLAAVPFPAAFTARTLNAYAVPFVSPVKVWAVLLVGVTQVLPASRDT